MKLTTNAQVFTALEPLRALNVAENRLATIPARLRIARAHEAVEQAWSVPDKERIALIREHGEEDGKGGISCLPGMAGWEAFVAAYNELLTQPTDVDVEPISMWDIEHGYAKVDGKREPIDISGPHLAALVALGMVTEPESGVVAPEGTQAPQAAA